MRAKMLIHRTALILLVGIILLFLSLTSFSTSKLPRAVAAPPPIPTSITGNTVTGNVTTQVVPPAPGGHIYGIRGGQTVGTNLFHSFGQFNVGPGDTAQFQTPNLSQNLAIGNILGRINGQQSASQIFGTIDSATFYPSANLFLMNPFGFLFGPSATVNVGGMVAFTSADYLRLQGNGGNGVFYADPAQMSILTSAPVAAFGFLGSNPGAITVQGSQLSATPGQSISLVGGNITIQSGTLEDGTVQPAILSASGGQINLASVASPGEVLAGTLSQALNINGQSFGALGTIQVLEQSVIDVSGNGGGTVLIRGGSFVLDNSTILAQVTGSGAVTNGAEAVGGGVDIQMSQNAVIQNGAVIDSSVTGNATPDVTYGGVHVKADSIQILGSQDFVNFPVTGIFSKVAKGSTGGNSGDIKLDANSIVMTDFEGAGITFIRTETKGAGNAGNISLTSTGDIQIDDGEISSASQGSASSPTSGNAGNITLTSMQGNISITDTSQLFGPTVASSTIGLNTSGHVGNISMSAPAGDILLADFGSFFTHIDGTGNNTGQGGIQITAKNLTIQNSAGVQIDNFTPFQPGDIIVNLTGGLKMNATDPSFPSTLLTRTRTSAQAADIDITAHDVALTGNSVISTETRSSGPGGVLNISAQTLQLTSGAQITSGTTIGNFGIPSGNGGIVTVQGLEGSGSPAQSVLIDGAGSGILTNTVGTGTGGNINMTAQSLTLQKGGALSAATFGTAPSASGGTILVKADTVTLNSGGNMTAVSTGPGASGEVVIQGLASPPQSIRIDGAGSGVFTDTQGTGAGGNIFVNANSVTIQNGGALSAKTSGTNVTATGGTITINASNMVTMTAGATVTASSTGPGNAGNISIDAGPQLAMLNSSIKTEAAQAGGGNINIRAVDIVRLGNSTVSTSVLGGTGSGGNITIDPNIVLLQSSQILAQATQGAGGNISILTNLLLTDPNSTISASSQFGTNGTVTVQSPISPASGKIIPLSQKPLIANALLNQRCAALAGGSFSSFTVAGRDSLPAEPGSWLSSPLALGISDSGSGTLTKVGSNVTLLDSADETPHVSLRQIAPSGFLTQTFAVDSSAGCTS